MRILAAPDKFRFSAEASAVADAISNGCWEAGYECAQLPLADGGEGLLDAFGGANRHSRVTGPLGAPVDAGWRLDNGAAVIEMAQASGLALVGGAEHNQPIEATSAGTGELIMHAVSVGARRIIVGLGGSATTDGGLGALNAIANPHRLKGIDLVAACDVRTHFRDAAAVFGPQKGASTLQVALLERRLDGLAERYRSELNVDVSQLDGAGAAGGLAGGLAAFGARIEPGFDVVAEELELDGALSASDLVITGEGHLDAASFDGKVVGGVVDWAAEFDTQVWAVVGGADSDALEMAEQRGVQVLSLSHRFGRDAALERPLQRIAEIVTEALGHDTAT